MSFFSRSSKRKPYKNGNNGYNHYRKKGFFGNLFRSHSYSPKHQHQQMQNQPMNSAYPDQKSAYQHTQQPPIQQSLTCKQCNTAIPNGSKFCLNCGWKVTAVVNCKSCHIQLPPHAKFCSECGTKAN